MLVGGIKPRGHRSFGRQATIAVEALLHAHWLDAKAAVSDLDVPELHRQLQRLRESHEDDPALAVGRAKEIVETTGKTISVGAAEGHANRVAAIARRHSQRRQGRGCDAPAAREFGQHCARSCGAPEPVRHGARPNRLVEGVVGASRPTRRWQRRDTGYIPSRTHEERTGEEGATA